MANKNGVPVVFTNIDHIGNIPRKDTVSMRDGKDFLKKNFAVVEINGKIVIKDGICATAIIAKAMNGTYQHILHWPELNEHGNMIVRKNGHDPNCLAVISDIDGNLHLKKGEDAKTIFEGNIPEGFQVEFIPPKKAKKIKRINH
jgi:hypothetical protein